MKARNRCLVAASAEYAFVTALASKPGLYEVIFLGVDDKQLAKTRVTVSANKTLDDAILASKKVWIIQPFKETLLVTDIYKVIVYDLDDGSSITRKRYINNSVIGDFLARQKDLNTYSFENFSKQVQSLLSKKTTPQNVRSASLPKKRADIEEIPVKEHIERLNEQGAVLFDEHAKVYNEAGEFVEDTTTTVQVVQPQISYCGFSKVFDRFSELDPWLTEESVALSWLLYIHNFEYIYKASDYKAKRSIIKGDLERLLPFSNVFEDDKGLLNVTTHIRDASDYAKAFKPSLLVMFKNCIEAIPSTNKMSKAQIAIRQWGYNSPLNFVKDEDNERLKHAKSINHLIGNYVKDLHKHQILSKINHWYPMFHPDCRKDPFFIYLLVAINLPWLLNGAGIRDLRLNVDADANRGAVIGSLFVPVRVNSKYFALALAECSSKKVLVNKQIEGAGLTNFTETILDGWLRFEYYYHGKHYPFSELVSIDDTGLITVNVYHAQLLVNIAGDVTINKEPAWLLAISDVQRLNPYMDRVYYASNKLDISELDDNHMPKVYYSNIETAGGYSKERLDNLVEDKLVTDFQTESYKLEFQQNLVQGVFFSPPKPLQVPTVVLTPRQSMDNNVIRTENGAITRIRVRA